MLHGLLTDLADPACVDFGLAAACLKHSVPGDFSPLGVADIAAFMSGDGFGLRR